MSRTALATPMRSPKRRIIVVRTAVLVVLAGAGANVAAAKQPYRQLFFDDQRLFVRAGF